MIKRIFSSLFGILIYFFASQIEANTVESIQPEIRKIIPPKLSLNHLGKKILCYRPMRRGTPKMDIETIGGTFVEGATPETPNDEEFAILVEGAKKFYGIE